MSRLLRRFLLVAGLLALAWVAPGQADSPRQKKAPEAVRLRRPVALLLADGGKRLLVANRDSGTVAVLDTQKREVVAEQRVGQRLSDLTATPNRDLILATDEQAGQVVLLAYRDGTLRELRRLDVGLSPASVRVSDDGRRATVACLWPRRLVILDLTDGKSSAPTALDLPFAPRRQLLLPGDKLLVADSFAGGLALVDLRHKTVEAVRYLTAHNLRGLSLGQGQGVWLTHQVLHRQGHPTPGDIRSASLLANNLHRLALASVLDPLVDLTRDDRLYALGDVELGAGDPAEAAELDDGTVLVALAGVDELAVGRPDEALWTRLPVGRRPTALAVDAARGLAYVANTFADSISLVDVREPKVLTEVRLGPMPQLRPEERGELLYYDARLSFESWFSCHSCHTDGHTAGRLNDNFTDGSFGTPKRVLSLLGVKDTAPLAWNGKVPDLETQVHTSVKGTMQGRTPSEEQVRDLAAYLRTLPPPPSLAQARGTLDEEARARGRRVFARQKCATCHTPPAYTSAGTYDVGLRDEAGESRFNPPSLRGVSQAGPYFHDGRAARLEDVFRRYRHQLSGEPSEQELSDLLHFLGGL